MKSKDKWTGEDIAAILEIVKTKVGKVIYAVTDGGGALIKGLKLSGISRVYDIKHAIAICLERINKNDVEFKDYVFQAGLTRSKLCYGQNAHLIPPNQRSKSRFLNIEIMSKWGIDVLFAFNKTKLLSSEAEALQWVKEHQQFIIEMNSLM